MTGLNRRDVVGGLVLAGGALSASPASAAPSVQKLSELKKEADVACLYHCDFGDPKRFSQMMRNIANHMSVYGSNPLELQLAVVAHGMGLKFFLDNLSGTPWQADEPVSALFESVENAAKSGLKVYLCNITFENLKIDRDKARKADFIQVVPSGVATVAALQSKGFAYLKTG